MRLVPITPSKNVLKSVCASVLRNVPELLSGVPALRADDAETLTLLFGADAEDSAVFFSGTTECCVSGASVSRLMASVSGSEFRFVRAVSWELTCVSSVML